MDDTGRTPDTDDAPYDDLFPPGLEDLESYELLYGSHQAVSDADVPCDSDLTSSQWNVLSMPDYATAPEALPSPDPSFTTLSSASQSHDTDTTALMPGHGLPSAPVQEHDVTNTGNGTATYPALSATAPVVTEPHSFAESSATTPSTPATAKLLSDYDEDDMPPLEEYMIKHGKEYTCAWVDVKTGSSCGRLCPDHTMARKHLKTHVRPYKCQRCHLRTAEQPDMRKHLKTHGSPRKFSCTVCEDKEFTRHDNLLKHMDRFHPGWK